MSSLIYGLLIPLVIMIVILLLIISPLLRLWIYQGKAKVKKHQVNWVGTPEGELILALGFGVGMLVSPLILLHLVTLDEMNIYHMFKAFLAFVLGVGNVLLLLSLVCLICDLVSLPWKWYGIGIRKSSIAHFINPKINKVKVNSISVLVHECKKYRHVGYRSNEMREIILLNKEIDEWDILPTNELSDKILQRFHNLMNASYKSHGVEKSKKKKAKDTNPVDTKANRSEVNSYEENPEVLEMKQLLYSSNISDEVRADLEDTLKRIQEKHEQEKEKEKYTDDERAKVVLQVAKDLNNLN